MPGRASKRASKLRVILPALFGSCVLTSGCIAITPSLERHTNLDSPPRFEAASISGFQHEGRLQELLRYGLRELGVARQIDPESPLRIDGKIIRSGPSTSGGRVAWNVVNTISLLFILGGPYVGSTSAEAELRVYDEGTLLVTETALGMANWRVHYEVIPRIIDARKRAVHRAEELALWNALSELASRNWP